MPKKVEEVARGILKLSKLSPEDVKKNRVVGIECKELDSLQVENNWEQLIEALLYVLLIRNPVKFIPRLHEAKVITPDFDVASDKFVIQTEKKPIYPVRIGDSKYFIYSSFNYKIIPTKINQLCNLLKVNIKQVKLELTPYSYVDQDEGFYAISENTRVRKFKLSDTANMDCNNNKMVAVEILGIKEECATYTKLLSIMLYYASKLDTRWFERAVLYNKDKTLKLGKTKEEAKVYENEPHKIEGTDCYINQRMNANEIMGYLREICNEFGISTSHIVLYCKDKDFSQLKIV